ncbi:MAG: adenylate/guanylate cyclase domain-containing protein, partial [Acidimicrobiia bacterium]
MDTSAFIAAGLYDPEADEADVRLAVLTFLTEEVGASIPEIVRALEEDRLLSMAALRQIRPAGPRLTLAQMAERAGVSLTFALRVWRAAGFRDPRPHERRFGEADIALLDVLRVGSQFVGEEATFQLVRTLGAASSQIAEAEISLVRSNMEAPLLAERQFVEVARTYRDIVAQLFHRVVDAIDTLHRHHVESISRRYVGTSPSAANVVALAVGFADLSGYTGISSKLDPEQLGIMLDRFETTTGDVVAAAGANVVKRMGDAVMFVTNAPGVGCMLGMHLVEACAAAQLPKLRVGIAFGDVIVRHGDFYGPT